MLHIGFTIMDRQGRIIVKDGALAVVKDWTIPLNESRDEMAEWLVCKAAIRQGGALTKGPVKFYSDCSVISKLINLDPAHKLPEGGKFPTGYGQLPLYESRELMHFYDTVGMLWTLFRGQWEAYQVEQERIVNGGQHE